jgi:hypothetical protein
MNAEPTNLHTCGAKWMLRGIPLMSSSLKFSNRDPFVTWFFLQHGKIFSFLENPRKIIEVPVDDYSIT